MNKREKQGFFQFSRKQFYTFLPYNLWISTGEEKYLKDFIRFASELKESIGRDKDGAVVAPDDGRKCRISVMILQDIATIMSRAGALTGDTGWFDEAVNQFDIYRKALRTRRPGYGTMEEAGLMILLSFARILESGTGMVSEGHVRST